MGSCTTNERLLYATLVCVVEAHPDALVYWEFNGQIVKKNQGYHMKIP